MIVDVQETRRAKLLELEREFGGQKGLIEKTGLAQAYLSNLKHSKASFGEKAARKIEKLTGKPYLWLDGIDSGDATATELARQISAILDSVPDQLRDRVLRELKSDK